MFRSLDHPQGATLFLAKVFSKTFIKFFCITRVLWQHVVLCNFALLGMCPAMLCVVCYVVRDWLPGGKVRPGRAGDHSLPSSAAIMEE